MTEETKLKPCPVPWCEESQPWAKSTLPMNGGWKFIVTCGGCGLTTNYFETEAEAIAAWNTRPKSELERLAQEVAKRWPWKGAQLTRDELVATQLIASQSEDFEELCAAIHALAAYFAKG